MSLNFLKSPESQRLERSMDASVLRGQLISHNIANVNTPNYKRLDIDFASVLEEAMPSVTTELARTNFRHLTGINRVENVPFRIVQENKTSSREDGNNVDVEFEMTQVTENTLHFQAVAQSWKQQMSRLKMAIEGR